MLEKNSDTTSIEHKTPTGLIGKFVARNEVNPPTALITTINLRKANMTTGTGASTDITEGSDSREEIQLEELILSFSYQLETLIRVLEGKGVLTRDELIAEFQTLLAEKVNAANPSASQVH